MKHPRKDRSALRPLGVSSIKRINQEIGECEQVRNCIKILLDFGRKHSFFESFDIYQQYRSMACDYITMMNQYKKNLTKGLYQEL